jgi:hypothetical protein
MKKFYLFFLIILTSHSSLFAADKQFYPDPLACPVNEYVIPKEIIASHGRDILEDLVTGKAGIKWNAQKDQNEIRLIFNKNTVIRRFQINLEGNNNDLHIPIKVIWAPQDSMWGNITRYFYVKPNGQTQCFFLGYLADIPENVAVHEIAFNLPAEIVLEKLSVSEKPSEVVMVSCPMPQLGEKIKIAYDKVIKNPSDINKERAFIILFEKSLYKYDCLRSYDYKPVPAWWLCDHEDVDKWLRLLSQMKSLEAKKLFGSDLFRETLDGEYAEEYYESSQSVGENSYNDTV